MTRKLLTAIVLMSVCALLPYAAEASAAEFTTPAAGPYPATLTAEGVEGPQLLLETSSGLSLTCEVATATGSLTEASSTLSLEPEYEGCNTKVSIFEFPTTVAPNG